MTVCEICSNTGGAYKSLDKPGKWIHSLCAAWIPEIYFIDSKEPAKLTINRIDKKRFKLKCGLCSTKGACVECKHGKCRTAAHPWCVLNNKKGGFTHRVVKDEDDELIWQIFCATHASSVRDALKPKPKSKTVQQLAAAPIPGSEAEKVKEKIKIIRDSSQQLSMAHSVKKNNSTSKKVIVDVPASIADNTGNNIGNGGGGGNGGNPGGKINAKNSSSGSSGSSGDKGVDAVSVSVTGTQGASGASGGLGKKIRGPYKKKGGNSTITFVADSDSDEEVSESKSRGKEGKDGLGGKDGV